MGIEILRNHLSGIEMSLNEFWRCNDYYDLHQVLVFTSESWQNILLSIFFRICVITVAPSHPLLQCKQIVKVNFQVSTKVNRLDNKVSGKGKKGAQHLQPESLICEVTSSDGSKYSLYRYERFFVYNEKLVLTL